MLKHYRLQFLLIISFLFLFACQSQINTNPTKTVSESPNTPSSKFITCTEPRSEICTREYRPVCATRDTGVRCVTTPCPSSEQVTKSNACTACADPKVTGYVVGACF